MKKTRYYFELLDCNNNEIGAFIPDGWAKSKAIKQAKEFMKENNIAKACLSVNLLSNSNLVDMIDIENEYYVEESSQDDNVTYVYSVAKNGRRRTFEYKNEKEAIEKANAYANKNGLNLEEMSSNYGFYYDIKTGIEIGLHKYKDVDGAVNQDPIDLPKRQDCNIVINKTYDAKMSVGLAIKIASNRDKDKVYIVDDNYIYWSAKSSVFRVDGKDMSPIDVYSMLKKMIRKDKISYRETTIGHLLMDALVKQFNK